MSAESELLRKGPLPGPASATRDAPSTAPRGRNRPVSQAVRVLGRAPPRGSFLL